MRVMAKNIKGSLSAKSCSTYPIVQYIEKKRSMPIAASAFENPNALGI